MTELTAPPVDVHHPDDNEPMVNLTVVGDDPGASFTTDIPGLAPVPLPVTITGQPTAVRSSWVAQIVADADTAGVKVQAAP